MSEPTPAPSDAPGTELLTQRYADQIIGTLGCWDRVILTGTLTDVCHAGAVEGWLRRDNIRCFDLKVFAEPLRNQVRDHAILTARAAGLSIEHIERRNFRKEDRVAAVLQKRGDAPGLGHVFSAMEACQAFKPWHDKATGKTGLRPTPGKCLHYYFYFLHARLGLVYVRVPMWLPFRLQIYFNGHNWLASRLRRAGLKFQMEDNALVECADWKKAQALADDFSLDQLKRDLDGLARQCVPALLERFRGGYHWSLMQVEYSLDLVWRSTEKLTPVYEELSRQAIFTVKAPEVAKFLGKRFPAHTDTALGSDLHTRVEGTRVKHFLGPASLKLYDKRGRVLRLECTVNDVTFFSHHRKVEHRDGPATYAVAPLKKSIFSLRDLRGLMHAATQRYLAWLSRLEDRSSGRVDLDKLSRPVQDAAARSWRGFNLFLKTDLQGLLAVLAGEHQISGVTSRRLQRLLPGWTRSQIARLLRRLRLHGLIKKVGRTYKYYATQFGQRLLLAACRT
ncbi:MAG: MarR family transcriptional regulator [Verrucomicrobia bacterium]|nr:MarR family transcriptional regulator [Verrucomicrobiota bacterium]